MHISGSDPQSRADSAFEIKDLEKHIKQIVDCPKKTENMNNNNNLLKKVENTFLLLFGVTTVNGFLHKGNSETGRWSDCLSTKIKYNPKPLFLTARRRVFFWSFFLTPTIAAKSCPLLCEVVLLGFVHGSQFKKKTYSLHRFPVVDFP